MISHWNLAVNLVLLVLGNFNLEKKQIPFLNKSEHFNNIKFPQINYFQTKKINLVQTLTDMIIKQKEKNKLKLIPKDYLNHPEYINFIKDIHNPSLGQFYIENKYPKLYNNFYVLHFLIRI